MATDTDTKAIAFLLVEGLSMMSLASAIEPLRSLNRLVGREAWRWRLVSLGGRPIAASNGIPLPSEPAEQAVSEADMLFVCGGLRIQSEDERSYLALLRKAARAGIPIGSLSTGSYLLARAGLLDGYRCTIHWENRPAFQEEFPLKPVSDQIFIVDRDRLTCSGGTAAMDLMLHLIQQRHGADLARRVANQFHHERIRNERDNQHGGRLERLAGLPAPLRTAVTLMIEHTESMLAIPAIARRAGLSSRQLERLFLRYCEMTPTRYYLALRLDRARELLIYSDRPIFEIAVATGFTSASHFSHWFKRIHGERPSELRSARQARHDMAPPPGLHP